MEKKLLIIDTDPGVDDALNLLWISKYVKNNQIELLAVTTVAGNVSSKLTFRNAYCVLDLLQIDTQKTIVAKQFIVPNENTQNHGDHFAFHSDDGIGGFSNDFKLSVEETDELYNNARYAPDIIIELINENPDQVILIATGPLTNIADAERKSPGIIDKTKEFIIMGGAYNVPGNVNPVAEFNVWFDPDSTKYIFNKVSNTTVMALDSTNQLQVSYKDIKRVASKFDNDLAVFLRFISKSLTKNTLGYRDADLIGFKIHDAAIFMYLLYPELFTFKRGHSSVETLKQSICYGKTLIDDRSDKDINLCNTWIAIDVDCNKAIFLFLRELYDVLEMC